VGAVFLEERNHEDFHRAELLSFFGDQRGEGQSSWLTELNTARFSKSHAFLKSWDLPVLRRRLDELAEIMAHERLLAERVALAEQLAREREEVISYVEAQEATIRQARLNDPYQRRQEALTVLQRRGELVPALKLEQVAGVKGRDGYDPDKWHVQL
jgi:hypothetical protein